LRDRYGRRCTVPQESLVIPPENEETLPDEVGLEVWVVFLVIKSCVRGEASERDVEDKRAQSSVLAK
jgi:hypothetical protein